MQITFWTWAKAPSGSVPPPSLRPSACFPVSDRPSGSRLRRPAAGRGTAPAARPPLAPPRDKPELGRGGEAPRAVRAALLTPRAPEIRVPRRLVAKRRGSALQPTAVQPNGPRAAL